MEVKVPLNGFGKFVEAWKSDCMPNDWMNAVFIITEKCLPSLLGSVKGRL